MIGKTTKTTSIMTMTILAGMLAIVPFTVNAESFSSLSLYPDESTLAGTANLIVDYRFDGSLSDSSGNGYDGVMNTGSESYVDSDFGEAFVFDFAGQNLLSIQIGTDESKFDFDYDDPFSLVVKIDDFVESGSEYQIYAKNTGATPVDSMYVTLDGSTDAFLFRHYKDTSNYQFCKSTTSVTDDDYVFAVTYDGTSPTTCNGVKMWINGVEDTVINQSSGTVTSNLNNAIPVIGSPGNNNGNMDFLKIYDDVLTESEILAIGNMTGFVDVGEKLAELEAENTSLQSQITSVNATVQHNVTEIDDLYDFWDDLRASIITWLAGRP